MTVPAPRLHTTRALAAVVDVVVVERLLVCRVGPGRGEALVDLAVAVVVLAVADLRRRHVGLRVVGRADVLAAVGRVAVEVDVARRAAADAAGRQPPSSRRRTTERVGERALVAAGAAVVGIVDQLRRRHVVDRRRCSRCRGRRRSRRRRWSGRSRRCGSIMSGGARSRRVPARSGPANMSAGAMTPLPESLQLRQYGFDLQPEATSHDERAETAARSSPFMTAPPPATPAQHQRAGAEQEPARPTTTPLRAGPARAQPKPPPPAPTTWSVAPAGLVSHVAAAGRRRSCSACRSGSAASRRDRRCRRRRSRPGRCCSRPCTAFSTQTPTPLVDAADLPSSMACARRDRRRTCRSSQN